MNNRVLQMDRFVGNSKTILAADDNEQSLGLLVECLASQNYEIVQAKDGQQAWDFICDPQYQFDALILDRQMPHLSGMDILSRLKQDEKLKHIPVMFQTGLSSEQDIIEGVQAGVYYYLTKPYIRKVLLSILDAAVNDYERYKKLKNEVTDNVSSMNMMVSGHFKLQTLEEARILACMLANACPKPRSIVTGLSELLINAIEHGNLTIGYEEKTHLLEKGAWREEIEHRMRLPENRNKFVEVSLVRNENEIIITLQDQGDGFDSALFMEIDPKRATHSHGRGVAFANLISFSSIEYVGCGNRLLARIQLCK